MAVSVPSIKPVHADPKAQLPKRMSPSLKPEGTGDRKRTAGERKEWGLKAHSGASRMERDYEQWWQEGACCAEALAGSVPYTRDRSNRHSCLKSASGSCASDIGFFIDVWMQLRVWVEG